MVNKQALSGLTMRQKVMGGVIALVVIIIIWQIAGLFGGGSSKPTTSRTTTKTTTTSTLPTPAKASLMAQPAQGGAPMTPREAALLRLQQETEAKYIAALNELQMLRVEKDIAETNKSIAKAKLDTVEAQKGIVDLLTVRQPPPSTYAQSLEDQAGIARSQTAVKKTTTTSVVAEGAYTVVSVSQLQYRWNAVMGYLGSLYNVSVGDVLPPDGSKVISIDRTGVVLEKDGTKKKVSLVPII